MQSAPAGRVAYVDGHYLRHGAAAVHIEDRGLQLGDSVYEVCRIANGRLVDEHEHLDRLRTFPGRNRNRDADEPGGAAPCDARKPFAATRCATVCCICR